MKTILKVNKVCKKFKTPEGTRQVLNNVSFEIEEGTCTVIGGENGSGKSLMMSIISDLESPSSGKIEKSCKCGLVFQEAETQILGETPEEDISIGPENLGWDKNKVKQAVEAALLKTGLSEKRNQPARFLSGGEKRRLAVACMLAMDLPMIILDEPYANLDYEGVKQVNALIKDLKNQGKTIIILTHEIEKCLGLANHFIVLFRGEIVFDGTPEAGLQQNLEQWNIRNPFVSYKSIEDLIW